MDRPERPPVLAGNDPDVPHERAVTVELEGQHLRRDRARREVVLATPDLGGGAPFTEYLLDGARGEERREELHPETGAGGERIDSCRDRLHAHRCRRRAAGTRLRQARWRARVERTPPVGALRIALLPARPDEAVATARDLARRQAAVGRVGVA